MQMIINQSKYRHLVNGKIKDKNKDYSDDLNTNYRNYVE